jgi:D-3-phosphoglycerate dehydrogenase / 2-oxoglutarate reductase
VRVLVSAPYFLPVVERFRPRFVARGLVLRIAPVVERLEEEELLPLVGDVSGVICGDDRFTGRVLAAAPLLRVISKWGTGIDSIDREACARHGVAVRNTPDAFSEPVADTVLGYILCFARRLPWMDAAMKGGRWEKIPSVALGECTLGIVGVGNVGRAVARRAVACGLSLLGNDPVPPPDPFLKETGMVMTDLPSLLGRSDFVSVNCDLNPTSRGLLDARAFAAMKPSAVLVNTARGPIVVERDLAAALAAGQIAGAALDVYEREPLPPDSPLLRMGQVMLAPHNSNSSPRAWERVHENTVRNLFDGLGVPP